MFQIPLFFKKNFFFVSAEHYGVICYGIKKTPDLTGVLSHAEDGT
jgi:hypothetical protein